MTGNARSDGCRPASPLGRLYGLAVTLICWAHFTLGFVCCFSFAYGGAYLLVRQRQALFQRLTSLFYRIFFQILRLLVPRCNWQIDSRAVGIRSSVIVCNHLSYLDPLLMISLFPRHKTIVKTKFFSVPIFGWVLRHNGYLPSDSTGRHTKLLITQMERMQDFLSRGGNLFIFPQGTRSRDGDIGSLNVSALKIARLYGVPVQIFHLAGTDDLYAPGHSLFTPENCRMIRLRIVDRIDSETVQTLPLAALEKRIREAFTQHNRQ